MKKNVSKTSKTTKTTKTIKNQLRDYKFDTSNYVKLSSGSRRDSQTGRLLKQQ